MLYRHIAQLHLRECDELSSFFFFGFGSALIGILWCVFKHSIQDAFAIAAYVVAFGTVSVGSVQALLVM